MDQTDESEGRGGGEDSDAASVEGQREPLDDPLDDLAPGPAYADTIA